VLRTYNVLDDDANFRKSVGSYEQLREYYHPRREFGAYSIHLLNDKNKISASLTDLGFIVN
jgi:ABC-type transporter lipoprotein component MlaA